MPDTLAALVRAKHPGAYDDMDDARLEAAVLNKYPGVYDDIPRATKLPSKPVSAEDFAPAPRNVLKDAAIGGLKGLGSSVMGLAEMAAATVPGGRTAGMLVPEARHPVFQRAEEDLAPTNDAQRIGKRAETAAEIAIPLARAATAVPAMARAARPMVAKAVEALASDTPVLTQIRKAAVKQIAGRLRPAVPNPNAGGTLVRAKAPTVESAISDALGDLKTAELPRRVDLPPPRGLPPGYQPRTTVPEPTVLKPKPAKMEAEAPIKGQLRASLKAQQAAPPSKATTPSSKRSVYFLRTPEEIAALKAPTETVEPLGRAVTVEDLPPAWRSRVTQPLLPPQGQAGAQLADEAAGELGARGLSAEDAIDAVTRNSDLTTQTRLQLQAALLSMLK